MGKRGRPGGEKTREAILEFIKEYVNRERIAPTFREIAAGVGLSSTSAVSHQIEVLESAGKVRRDFAVPRSIRLEIADARAESQHS